MLGKGLESLIPQKGNGSAGAGADGVSSQPPASEPEARREEPREDAGAQSQPRIQPQQASPGADTVPSFAAPAVPAVPATPMHEPQREARPIFAPPTSSDATAFQKQHQNKAGEPQEAQSVFHIEIDKVKPNPSQPRRNFDEAGLRDLAHSIREFGFLQPLVVSRIEKETADGVGVEYQLIAGERRLMAAKMLGLATVPAIVRNVDLEREKLELAVIENIQRENLNPIETARAFQRLQEEFRMTQREIAAKLGKSREVVANAVRLLDLPEEIQVAVQKGDLSESSARMLLAVGDPGAQKRLFEDIVQNRLTTRDVKERVQQFSASTGTDVAGAHGHRRGRPPKSAEAPLPTELRAMQESLSSDLGAPVEIHKGASNGRITITFYSEEELENILRKLGKERF